ncbi:hypothetical protein DPMN_133357 [Dreissena polymorpha]|uniref:Uncharacterized protein n=1 Tax=Dreissena polymorpha TaxID=45954 RepID=A0A9D4FU42_DREPO|nr:hypothetical protein DPMN_133357 [Dreissena polymorpha]
MLDNDSTYKNYIDGDHGVHISCMKQSDGNTRSWATEAEILAASTFYDVDIYVKQSLLAVTKRFKNRYESPYTWCK